MIYVPGMGRVMGRSTMKNLQTHKLAVTSIEKLLPGMHHDGLNLYLQVSRNKVTGKVSRSWIYRYRLGGVSHDMGLGAYPRIGLSGARRLAEGVAMQLVQGIDPIKARRAQRALKRDSDAKTRMTLKRAISTYLSIKKSKWGKAQKDKWESPLRLHVYPKFGGKHVSEVDEKVVRAILEPLWGDREATARKIRERLYSVLQWGMYMGHIPRGPNPAEWKDALDTHFQAGKKTINRAAMPYVEVPGFMKALTDKTTVAAKALRFLILTATRTNEVLGAMWSEIDLDGKIWTIPGSRMKSGKEHKVPLSSSAITIIESMQAVQISDYVFPGTMNDQPLDETILRYVKTQMGYNSITIHGFRSSFKDWCSEETDYPNEVSEMALAHSINSAVEAAYRRGSLFKKRIQLMGDWGKYCSP